MEWSVPEEVIEPIYLGVGHLVVSWSFVEIALDHWITLVYHNVDGKKIEKQIPRNLTDKLQFLTRCFERIDALAPFSMECLPCLEKIETLSETRHFIVHGVLSHFEPTSQELLFVKLELINKKTMHKLSEFRITGPRLVEQGIECTRLASSMMKVTKRLLQAFV